MRCLDDGRLYWDNNLAENVQRPITLSRKNFLFCGNHEAAANMSVICSLLATCKAHDVNPRNYLNDVIAQMPYHKKGNPRRTFGSASTQVEAETSGMCTDKAKGGIL